MLDKSQECNGECFIDGYQIIYRYRPGKEETNTYASVQILQVFQKLKDQNKSEVAVDILPVINNFDPLLIENFENTIMDIKT